MRILVVDDHVLFREGLANLLDSQPDIQIKLLAAIRGLKHKEAAIYRPW